MISLMSVRTSLKLEMPTTHILKVAKILEVAGRSPLYNSGTGDVSVKVQSEIESDLNSYSYRASNLIYL